MEEVETTVSPRYERGTLEEVYRKVERDLLEGIDLISDDSYSVPKYHFTRKAAYAFAARFYLYYMKPDFSNCDRVIDLPPVYWGLILPICCATGKRWVIFP